MKKLHINSWTITLFKAKLVEQCVKTAFTCAFKDSIGQNKALQHTHKYYLTKETSQKVNKTWSM